MAKVFAVRAPVRDGSVVVGARLHSDYAGALSELSVLVKRFPKAFIAGEEKKPAPFHAVFFRTPAGAVDFIVCFNVETLLEWEVLHRRAMTIYGWEDWQGRRYIDFIAKSHAGKDAAMRFSGDCSNRLRALTDKEKPPAPKSAGGFSD